MMLICPSIPIFFDIPFLHQQMNSNKTRIMFSYEGIECACRHCVNELSEKRCQATTKESLAEHQRGIHEGVKYPCRQCGKQFSQKGALARHQRAAHEGIKYLCGKYDYQATAKVDLAKHHRGVHEGVKYPCG